MPDQTPPLHPDWVVPRRTALLLIDCQVDFGAPDGAMAQRGYDITACRAALQCCALLADAARTAGVPVVFVRLIHYPGGDTAITREAKARRHDDAPPLCRQGSHGAEFTGVHPAPGDRVVTKTLFSAFHNTELDQLLHGEGIDTLVLAGLTTECCVASTAWDAFERDFHIFIAQDACAAYEAGLHAGALAALELSGAGLYPAVRFAEFWK